MSDVYEPRGLRFFDLASGRKMILVDESEPQFAGWLCYRHADGQWVSLREATVADKIAVARANGMVLV